MHPSLSRAFQRHQEHNLKHPGLMYIITTKQNKLPAFIDRCFFYISIACPIVFVKSHVKVLKTTQSMRKSATSVLYV
jgi:hypothetical protein